MRDKKPDTRELYDAFLIDPENMSDDDAAAELAGDEDAAAALRARVAAMAQTLGADLRRAGIPAPPVLKDVAAMLVSSDVLPPDEKLARSRASARLADLERKQSVPRNYELLEAARKGPGELAPEDEDLLEHEAEDLRREIDGEHDKTK